MGLRELGDWVYDAKLSVEIRYQFQYIYTGNKIFLLTVVEVLIVFFYSLSLYFPINGKDGLCLFYITNRTLTIRLYCNRTVPRVPK